MSGRVNLGKRKLNTAISTIQEKIAKALNVTPEEINLDTRATEDVDLLRIKAGFWQVYATDKRKAFNNKDK